MFIFINKDANDKKAAMFHADYMMYQDNESLVNDADTIVIGTVAKVHEPEEIVIGKNRLNAEEEKTLQHEASFIYTVSDIKIERVLKGDYAVGDIIKIKQLGDGEKLVAEDVKYLKQDSRQLFFLQTYPGTGVPASVLNPVQGQIELSEGKILKQDNNKLFENVVNEKEIVDVIEKAINVKKYE